jgi:hypothetical protein
VAEGSERLRREQARRVVTPLQQRNSDAPPDSSELLHPRSNNCVRGVWPSSFDHRQGTFAEVSWYARGASATGDTDSAASWKLQEATDINESGRMVGVGMKVGKPVDSDAAFSYTLVTYHS